MKENLIDKLHEADMLYFVLVSLFSADTLVDAESCRKSLEALAILKRDFETSSLKDDQELKAMIDDAEEIILRDLKDHGPACPRQPPFPTLHRPTSSQSDPTVPLSNRFPHARYPKSAASPTGHNASPGHQT